MFAGTTVIQVARERQVAPRLQTSKPDFRSVPEELEQNSGNDSARGLTRPERVERTEDDDGKFIRAPERLA